VIWRFFIFGSLCFGTCLNSGWLFAQVAIESSELYRRNAINECLADPLLDEATRVLEKAEKSRYADQVNEALRDFDTSFSKLDFSNSESRQNLPQEAQAFFDRYVSSPAYRAREFVSDLQEVGSKAELRQRFAKSFENYLKALNELSEILEPLTKTKENSSEILFLKKSDLARPEVVERLNKISESLELTRARSDKLKALQEIFDWLRLVSIQRAFSKALVQNPDLTWPEIEKLGFLNELSDSQKTSLAVDYEHFVNRRTSRAVQAQGSQLPLAKEEAEALLLYRSSSKKGEGNSSQKYSEVEIKEYYLEPIAKQRAALTSLVAKSGAQLKSIYETKLLPNIDATNAELFVDIQKQYSLQARVTHLFTKDEIRLIDSDKINLSREKAKALGILDFYSENLVGILDEVDKENTAYKLANEFFVLNRLSRLTGELTEKLREQASERARLIAEDNSKKRADLKATQAKDSKLIELRRDLQQLLLANPDLGKIEAIEASIKVETDSLEKRIEISTFATRHALDDWDELQERAKKLGYFDFIDKDTFALMTAGARAHRLVEKWAGEFLASPLASNPFYSQTPFYNGPKNKKDLWDQLKIKYQPELDRLKKDFPQLAAPKQIESEARLAASRSTGLREFDQSMREIGSLPQAFIAANREIQKWSDLRSNLEKRNLLDWAGFDETQFRNAYVQSALRHAEQELSEGVRITSYLNGYRGPDAGNDINDKLSDFGKAIERSQNANKILKMLRTEHSDLFNEKMQDELQVRINQFSQEATARGRADRTAALSLQDALAKEQAESQRWYQRWGEALYTTTMNAGESLHIYLGGTLGGVASLIAKQDYSWGADYINWTNRYANTRHGFSVLGSPDQFAMRDSAVIDTLVRANPILHATSVPFAIAKPILEPIEPALAKVLQLPQKAYDKYTTWALGFSHLSPEDQKANLEILRRGILRRGPDGKWEKVGKDGFVEFGNYAFQTSELIGAVLLTRGIGGSRFAAEKGSRFIARFSSGAQTYQQAVAVGQALQGAKTIASVAGMSAAAVVGQELYYSDKQNRPFDYGRAFADTLEGSSQSGIFSMSMSGIQRLAVAKQFGGRIPKFDSLNNADKIKFANAIDRGGRYVKRIDFIEGMSGFGDSFEMYGNTDSFTQFVGATLVTGSNVYDTFDNTIIKKINGLSGAQLLKGPSIEQIRASLGIRSPLDSLNKNSDDTPPIKPD